MIRAAFKNGLLIALLAFLALFKVIELADSFTGF